VAAYSYLSSSVPPGGTASFAIFVWTTASDSSGTTLTVSIAKTANVDSPTFAVCPSPNGAVCDLGGLETNQSTELVAGATTTSSAASGTKVTLTAKAQATGADPYQAQATVTVTTGAASSSSSTSAGDGDTDLPNLPGLSDLPGFSLPGGSLPDGAYTTPTNPSGLFPTVTPGSGKSKARNGVVTDAAILPLDSRLIGWQVAGLVVLAAAIAIAVVRLSLRTRPNEGRPAAQ
jgi:hypothetical protein